MSNHTTGRNHAAVVAHSRNSAGSMKDKRAPRGGARNQGREIMDTYMDDIHAEQAEVQAVENDARWARIMQEDAAARADEEAERGEVTVWEE